MRARAPPSKHGVDDAAIVHKLRIRCMAQSQSGRIIGYSGPELMSIGFTPMDRLAAMEASSILALAGKTGMLSPAPNVVSNAAAVFPDRKGQGDGRGADLSRV
jgi:hypothetical protein